MTRFSQDDPRDPDDVRESRAEAKADAILADLPAKKTPVETCQHATLTFGSGSYYVFCSNCGHSWVCAARESSASAHICDGACSRPRPPKTEKKP